MSSVSILNQQTGERWFVSNAGQPIPLGDHEVVTHIDGARVGQPFGTSPGLRVSSGIDPAVYQRLLEREVSALEAAAEHATGRGHAIASSTNGLIEDGFRVVGAELRRLAIAAEQRNALHAEAIDLQRHGLDFARDAEARQNKLGEQIAREVASVSPEMQTQGIADAPRFVRPERINEAVDLIGVQMAAGKEPKLPETWIYAGPDQPRQAVLRLSAKEAHDWIAEALDGRARKRADIFFIRMLQPFVVTTEHGDMEGAVGDYLACNDPDVDPGSDAWPISAERFAATYSVVVADAGTPEPARGPWFVLRDPTTAPAGWVNQVKVTHPTYQEAADAADRLARSTGGRFFILEATAYLEPGPAIFHEGSPRDLDDLPF